MMRKVKSPVPVSLNDTINYAELLTNVLRVGAEMGFQRAIDILGFEGENIIG
jgi:hypothetical protein